MATGFVSSPDNRTLEAARELRRVLKEADENGHGVGAWYFYMNRRHIEVVVEAILGPEPVEPEPTFTMTITGPDGEEAVREVTREVYDALMSGVSA